MTGATCTVRFIVTVGLPLFEVQPVVNKLADTRSKVMSVFMGTSLFECEPKAKCIGSTSKKDIRKERATRKKNGTSQEKSAQLAALKFDDFVGWLFGIRWHAGAASAAEN